MLEKKEKKPCPFCGTDKEVARRGPESSTVCYTKGVILRHTYVWFECNRCSYIWREWMKSERMDLTDD